MLSLLHPLHAQCITLQVTERSAYLHHALRIRGPVGHGQAVHLKRERKEGWPELVHVENASVTLACNSYCRVPLNNVHRKSHMGTLQHAVLNNTQQNTHSTCAFRIAAAWMKAACEGSAALNTTGLGNLQAYRRLQKAVRFTTVLVVLATCLGGQNYAHSCQKSSTAAPRRNRHDCF